MSMEDEMDKFFTTKDKKPKTGNPEKLDADI